MPVASLLKRKNSSSLLPKARTSALGRWPRRCLARTIADIEEQKQVSDAHVAEAFGLRFGGGLKW